MSVKLNKTEYGRVILYEPGGTDRVLAEARTLQCSHCGGHWVPRPGSGLKRGYCFRCNGPICGPHCTECVPVEQQLENYEKHRPLDFRPIIVPASFGGES